MSLINDALKRAKESQQQQPPAAPPGPPLRPVERPQGRGGNLWLTVAFAVVLAAAAILLWQWVQQGRKPASEIAANATTPPSTPALAKPTLPPPSPKPIETAAAPAPAPTIASKPAPVAPQPTELVPTPPLAGAEPKPSPPALSAQPAPTPAAATVAATNAVGGVAPTAAPSATEAPPKRVLKLQGIFYHPTRPSAIINGKSVFVGDRAGEFRVIAIERESVTLGGGGTTNILSLQ
jgi:hypothetical protein